MSLVVGCMWCNELCLAPVEMTNAPRSAKKTLLNAPSPTHTQTSAPPKPLPPRPTTPPHAPVSAEVSVIPCPPALVDSRNTNGAPGPSPPPCPPAAAASGASGLGSAPGAGVGVRLWVAPRLLLLAFMNLAAGGGVVMVLARVERSGVGV